ncbi:hypothetical protein [Streptomyces sp. NBC_00454]|uniref:hypothetical protein n=1 Tax=Streptomyces sp. NBC_00454 TaxID=2975747 RepID=UPI0030DE225C
MSEAPGYARSSLFRDDQNPALAREAAKRGRVFADREFVRRWIAPGSGLRGWESYAQSNDMLRHILDGVLIARAAVEVSDNGTTDWPVTRRRAGLVEAVFLPSLAMESRVFENPGEQAGHVIAVSPLVCELSANIAWALPLAYEYAGVGRVRENQELVEALDECVLSYLRSTLHRDPTLTKSVIPHGVPCSSPYSDTVRQVWRSNVRFTLCHELSHIEMDHFGGLGRSRVPNFLSHLPDEIRREAEADCAAFTWNMNAAIWEVNSHRRGRLGGLTAGDTGEDGQGDEGRDGHVDEAEAGDGNLGAQGPTPTPRAPADPFTGAAVKAILRATEASDCFYVTMEILTELARHLGDEAKARRLSQVTERKQLVRKYVYRLRTEELSETYGVHVWDLKDFTKWTVQDDFVAHIAEKVIPRV